MCSIKKKRDSRPREKRKQSGKRWKRGVPERATRSRKLLVAEEHSVAGGRKGRSDLLAIRKRDNFNKEKPQKQGRKKLRKE